ncbi:MAG: hypothetical protein AAB116_12070 [Candidatus Poribacteria bacterium]
MILRFKIIFVIIFTLFFLQSFSYAQNGQRIAVLYFSDHSKFDSGSGCSWFSLGPLNSIFGIGQSREKWNLSSGFRDLLNESLKSSGYSIIEPSYVDEVIRESGRDNISGLANKLGADIVMVGNITKFEQHRTRVSSQGPTRANTGGEYSMQANFMGGLAGYYYSSSVKTVFMVYDNSGTEVDRSEITSKKDLQDFYIGIGPMSKNYKGGEASDKEKPKESQQPIVDYKKLDTMKFGTNEFKDKTLFGLATMDVVNQMVTKVSEHVEPSSQPNVMGKILYIGDGKYLKENEVYIDLGAGDGLVVGNKFAVYIEGIVLTDPNTGKELGKSPDKKLGSIKITNIQAEHLSIAEIVEGLGQIAKGNIIKAEINEK